MALLYKKKKLNQSFIIYPMSSFQLDKTQKCKPLEKRISITNIPGLDRIERYDKNQKNSEKPIDKVKKSIERMENTLKDYQFELFDLRELEENYALIRNNRKFSTLLNTLKMYNKKLEEKRQHDIINYKLHEFYYSTLRICNTKTQTEVQFYLEEINSWLNKYNHKRQLIFHPNKKYVYNKDEDDAIRQTFKSNLPLEVDQYKRRLCVLTAPKDKKGKVRLAEKSKKMNNTLGKFNVNADSQNSDGEYIKELIDDQKKHERKLKNKQLELPNLRAYRAEILKVRKARQDREQSVYFQNLKKNQSRNLTQSSNNFYKPLRNRNDIFNKQNRTNQEGCVNDGNQKTGKQLQEGDSATLSRDQLEDNTERQRQNNRVIVASTCMGFYEIKKKNLNKALGIKTLGQKVAFPKFFMNTDGYFNQGLQKFTETDALQSTNKQNSTQMIVPNITGLSLLKNPIEVTKTKKEKKNK